MEDPGSNPGENFFKILSLVQEITVTVHYSCSNSKQKLLSALSAVLYS